MNPLSSSPAAATPPAATAPAPLVPAAPSAHRWGWLLPVAAAALLAVLPLGLTSYTQDLVLRIMIYAIFALSLELLVGTTGLVSLGHAGFYGLAAYCTVLASPAAEPANLLWLLPLAMAAAGLYALLVGALSLRTRGVYFIMV